MELNGPGALNDAALNDVQQPFSLLKVGELSDAVSPEDGGRLLIQELFADGSLTILENVIKVSTGVRIVTSTITEALGITDSILAARLRNRLGNESIVALDQSPLGRLRSGTFSELLSVGDSPLRAARFFRQVDEVLTLIDQIIGSKVKPWTVTENFSLTDTGRYIEWDVLASAPLTIIDELISSVISSGGAIVRVASDAVILADGHTRALLRARSMLDAVVMAEGELGRETSINATFTETFDVVDEFLARRLRRVQTSDGVTLLDMLTSSTSGNRVVSSTDAVIVGDAAIVSRLRGRTAADIIGLSDVQLRSVQRLLESTEAITFNDNQIRVLWNDRRMSEFLGLPDDIAKSILYAVLYDVRPVLRARDGFELSARDTAVMRSRDGFRLGVH